MPISPTKPCSLLEGSNHSLFISASSLQDSLSYSPQQKYYVELNWRPELR